MDSNIVLDRFTVHYIDKKNGKYVPGWQVLQEDQLDESVSKFIHKLISDVWDAEETGKVNSAKFLKPPNDVVAKIVSGLSLPLPEFSPTEFLGESVKLADYLNVKTPGSASPGLLGVFRLTHTKIKEKVYIALLKIQAKDESFVRLEDSAITQMTVEAVKNLLLDKIQKGAIYPHPNKRNFELKVVDKQTPEEPAVYFSKNFLGCEVKRSDDIQLHSLISELESYAHKRNLPFANERVPALIGALFNKRGDITTKSLANEINKLGLLGKNFAKGDFISFIDHESKLGSLDIPIQYFQEQPGAKPRSRKLSVKFIDPRYLGVELTGPLDLIESLMTRQRGFVTFTIATNQNGFHFEWK